MLNKFLKKMVGNLVVAWMIELLCFVTLVFGFTGGGEVQVGVFMSKGSSKVDRINVELNDSFFSKEVLNLNLEVNWVNEEQFNSLK